MKRLAFQLALYAGIVCWSLNAQTINLRANVPFPFRIGQTVMPAGEYSIYNTGSALIVREQGNSHSVAMVVPRYDVRLDPSKASVLEFNRYGATYFLAKIWTAGSMQGRAIPPSRDEKQLARQFELARKTSVSVASR